MTREEISWCQKRTAIQQNTWKKLLANKMNEKNVKRSDDSRHK